MVLVRQRAQLKNRIHATLAKYALHCDEVSELFGARGVVLLRQHLEALPPHTAFATGQLLEPVEGLARQARAFDQRTRGVFQPTLAIERLRTLPGVGFILAVVIALEVGDVTRFPDAERLPSYAGTTPRVRASGGKTRYGALRPDVSAGGYSLADSMNGSSQFPTRRARSSTVDRGTPRDSARASGQL